MESNPKLSQAGARAILEMGLEGGKSAYSEGVDGEGDGPKSGRD